MLIRSFSAGSWQTNCYIAAPARNSECVIIDPGYECVDQVQEILNNENLKPVAVLLTHGHIDHMWSVFPLASGYDIPTIIHKNDRHLLANPLAGISIETIAMLQGALGTSPTFTEPDRVIELDESMRLQLAGMDFKIQQAPGHTEGSTLFTVHDELPTIFTGDVLFAGAIGRTDLPGGSERKMTETLRDVILPLSDDHRVLPGHGPETTMAQERVNNPFLIRVAEGLEGDV